MVKAMISCLKLVPTVMLGQKMILALKSLIHIIQTLTNKTRLVQIGANKPTN